MNGTLNMREIPLPGPDRAADRQAFSMRAVGGVLYFGTRNRGGARLHRLGPDGRVEPVLRLDPDNVDIYGIFPFGGRLLLGTYNEKGGQLLRLHPDGRLETIFDRGLDDPDNKDIWSLAEHRGRLYFGTWNNRSGGKIYLGDGESFRRVWDSGDPAVSYVRAFAELDGRLHASLGNRCSPPVLLHLDGERVETVPTPMLPPRGDVYVLRAFRDRLFLGVAAYHANEAVGGAEVWSFDGRNFSPSALGGFGNPNNIYILSITEWSGALVCATYNFKDGCELWASADGDAWKPLVRGGFGQGPANESVVYGLEVLDGRLYAATRNTRDGCRLYVLDCDERR